MGMDASRFDQHVSVQALEFEHSLYNSVFRNGKLEMLLNMQLYNTGYANASDGYFKYRTVGSRMSGDMNTSLGNKILMCTMAKSYLDHIGGSIEFVNNGDDCLMIMDKGDLHRLTNLKEYFSEFGFNIVCEPPVYEFEHIEFCQSKPLFASDKYRMVRNLKTCLSKDLSCVNLGHNVDEYRAWLYDVGCCGAAVAADVPVFGAFYNMMKRMGREGNYSHKANRDYMWYHTASKDVTINSSNTITPEARLSFFISYDICPELQQELENSFNSAGWGDSKRQLTSTYQSLF